MAIITAILVVVGGILMNIFAPQGLRHYESFPGLESAPKLTIDSKGVAGDPINIALIGTETEIAIALRKAGWVAADSLSRASKFAIARSVLLNRPDSTAPVSSLFLFNRRQDIAFEREVGSSARRRHHVRLWRDSALSYAGRQVWIGGTTYDLSAGISHRGLHPTHHIASDIDEERELLEAALAHSGQAQQTFRVTGIGVQVNAHNAEGDRYNTDGELRVVVVPIGNVPQPSPSDPGVPASVRIKDRIWQWGHRLGRAGSE